MTPEQEDELLEWADKFDTRIMKSVYVFRMGAGMNKPNHSAITRQGARRRMLNAALELRAAVEELANDLPALS